jgi:hypothetical protein
MDETVLTQDELRHAVREVFKRSQMDPAFRALCLRDPHEALRTITGKVVPADLKIQFLDSAVDK